MEYIRLQSYSTCEVSSVFYVEEVHLFYDTVLVHIC